MIGTGHQSQNEKCACGSGKKFKRCHGIQHNGHAQPPRLTGFTESRHYSRCEGISTHRCTNPEALRGNMAPLGLPLNQKLCSGAKSLIALEVALQGAFITRVTLTGGATGRKQGHICNLLCPYYEKVEMDGVLVSVPRNRTDLPYSPSDFYDWLADAPIRKHIQEIPQLLENGKIYALDPMTTQGIQPMSGITMIVDGAAVLRRDSALYLWCATTLLETSHYREMRMGRARPNACMTNANSGLYLQRNYVIKFDLSGGKIAPVDHLSYGRQELGVHILHKSESEPNELESRIIGFVRGFAFLPGYLQSGNAQARPN